MHVVCLLGFWFCMHCLETTSIVVVDDYSGYWFCKSISSIFSYRLWNPLQQLCLCINWDTQCCKFVVHIFPTTTHSTTHAICWDIEHKRILDSEYRNEKFFTYTTFDCHSQEATAIVEALSTTINIPCIFTIAYWKKKVEPREND